GGLSQFEYRHRVTDITQAQIETYLRRLTTFLGLEMGPGYVPFEAIRLFREYDREAVSNPENATRSLVMTIMQQMIPILCEMKKSLGV
ncbi:MAG TPA: hypothetical protein VN659_06990, partial [Pyrinomonadaceae bacterium]|nr:hypothetical protein [Pyrinomonadaceae bacterium]